MRATVRSLLVAYTYRCVQCNCVVGCCGGNGDIVQRHVGSGVLLPKGDNLTSFPAGEY